MSYTRNYTDNQLTKRGRSNHIPVKVTHPSYKPRLSGKVRENTRTRSCNLIEVVLATDQATCTTSTANRNVLPDVLLLNARSVFNKKDELAVLIDQHKSDLVMVTETWLTENVPNEAVHIPGLTIIRKDRNGGRGGGVAIYVRDHIPVKVRNDLIQPPFECLWVTIRPKWLPRVISKIAVACIYLPPTLVSSDLESFYDYFCYCCDLLTSESQSTAIIAAGDFNPSSNGFQINLISKHCQLKQLVKAPTRGTAVLDLILTNVATWYENPSVLAPIAASDHCVIKWQPKDRSKDKNILKKIKVRPLRQSSLREFNEYLKFYDWSPVLHAVCTNSKTDLFLELTNKMIDAFFPEKIVKLHENDKSFITGRIKCLLVKRDKAYKQGNWGCFKALRRLISSEIRKEKKLFYDDKVRPTRCSNPKAWWKNINKLVGKRNNSVKLLDPETNTPMNDKQTANHINSFFASLTKNLPPIQGEWIVLGTSDPLPTIECTSVENKLKHLNESKTPGPYDPTIKLIKMFAKSFAIPLTNIFNESFRSRVFPEIWKKYSLCAVPKVAPCSVVDELRPIALTSVLSKVQESYAVEWIHEDVCDRINESQFGGLPGGSAVLALINLLHKWYKAMESRGKIVRIVFLDFRKAFDLIEHNKLLENFSNIGLRPALIAWLGSYLCNRQQITKYGNEYSDVENARGGVPQGSKIGPIAFIVHINQLPLTILHDRTTPDICEEDITMFMDDTTLSEVVDVSSHTPGSPIGNSQANVEKVLQFAREQYMELNAKKCKEMQIDFRRNKTDIHPIYIAEQAIDKVSSYKLLGLWIDDDLKWNTNTIYITKKAVKRLYFLKILKSYGAPTNDLKAFYIAVIRSTLEYAAQVWNGNLTHQQSADIERIQKRALRIIYAVYDYDQLLHKSGLKTLRERRDNLCVDLIKNMSKPSHKLHSLLPKKIGQVRERDTRTNDQSYYNYTYKTERFKKSPIVFAIDQYNSKFKTT